MRPVHIVVLLLAGALGGAMIMRAIHQPTHTAPPTVLAQVPAPTPPSPPPAVVVPAPPAVEPEPPAPVDSTVTPARKSAPVRIATHKPSPFRPFTPPPTPAPPVAAPPVAADNPELVQRPVTPPADAPPHLETLPAEASPATAPPPMRADTERVAPPAPQPHHVTLNAGMLLPVRLVDGLSSERNVPGDTFLATLDKELVVDGFVIAERGARVEGRVVAADRGGKVRGVAALAVNLTRLHTADGQSVALETDDYFQHAEATRGNDAAKVGGGAILGAVIGAIAGGGKGAAIGAGVGGGAGAGDVLLTRGKAAELASESRVTFRLKTAVPLTERLR